MLFITFVAASLGIPTAFASTIVNIILGAGTLVTVLTIISTIFSSGATTLMTLGWITFKTTVKSLAKKSMAKAIAW